MFLKTAAHVDEEGIVLNFYEEGTVSVDYKGVQVEIEICTQYPIDGRMNLHIKTSQPKEFKLKIRIPGWTGEEGYLVYERAWLDDKLTITWEMPLREVFPEVWETDVVYTDLSKNTSQFHCALAETVYHKEKDDWYVAIQRGPLTLAADSRCGRDIRMPYDFACAGDICEEKEIASGKPCMVKMRFVDKKGKEFYLVDYASAGQDWKSEIAAWLPTK